MNPFLSKEMASEHIRDLHEQSARSSRRRKRERSDESEHLAAVRIRRFTERDIDAVVRLAELDEKPTPTGGVLVAEIAGELVAALPLDGGPAIADPFRPTADVVGLLRLRARQLRASGGTDRRRRLAWKPAFAGHQPQRS